MDPRAELYAELTGRPAPIDPGPVVAAEGPEFVAFEHPDPVAALHWIVAPRAAPARPGDPWPGAGYWAAVGELVARAGGGARLVADPGPGARFHVHLLAGRPFGWPPG